MSTPGGGHLANYSGGFIGQGARLRGGKLRFKPGEWKPVDGPGSKVALWTELMFSVPGGADEGKVAELPELKQDEGRPRDSEQAQPSRRDQRKAKTKAKYERWYQTARKFKSERKDDEPLRPIEIAKMVAKKEKAATNTEANPETIKRRLNENYQGWAD